MVLSVLCLLALTGALGLGFGTLIGALHASWPAHPWAAAGAAVAGRRGCARPEAWAAGGGLLLGASAVFALGVSGPGGLLLLRLVGGMGGGGAGDRGPGPAPEGGAAGGRGGRHGRGGSLVAAAVLAPGAFGAPAWFSSHSCWRQQHGILPRLAGLLAAAAALAPVLAGPLAGVLGEVAARRCSLYSASAALLASIALGFALRPAGPGWGVLFLAVAWGAAGVGLPALIPLAAAMAGPEGARPARVAVGALGHLGTGMILLVATTGAGLTLWVGLAAAAAAGGLVMLCVKD